MGMDKVICVDLDGTLFYPPRRVKMISDGNKKFIDRFLDDGGRLVLVSGRNLYTPMKVAEVLGRDIDVIGCNGAFVLSGGHYVKETFFEKEFAKNLLKEVGREFPVRLTMLFTKHRNIVMPLSGVGSWTGFCYSVYQLSQMAYRDPVIRFDLSGMDVYGNIVEIADETRPSYAFERLLEQNRENFLARAYAH